MDFEQFCINALCVLALPFFLVIGVVVFIVYLVYPDYFAHEHCPECEGYQGEHIKEIKYSADYSKCQCCFHIAAFDTVHYIGQWPQKSTSVYVHLTYMNHIKDHPSCDYKEWDKNGGCTYIKGDNGVTG